MRFRPFPLLVAVGMALGTLSPAAAQMTAPPPLTQPAAAAPPGRVGRIASVSGSVSFHLAGATEWQVASPNLPLTTRAGLFVAAGGEAAIGVGSGNRVVLAPLTEFDIDQLDDQALAVTQPQGESYLHLRLVPAPDTYTVRTPRGTVTIATAGRYAIFSGDTEHPTTVTVLDGAATLTGIPQTAEIGAGQTLTVTGDGAATPFTPSLGPAVQDEFLRHALAEERPPAPRRAVEPAIVAQMTGAEALADVGDWTENAEYGPVWYPPVASYVPYRQGRWAYVAPWGWTWIDDAPWGFAPSHYGRWAQFDGRWGWVPGRDWAPDRPPVYAPALVGFIGGAALGFGRGPMVGWAPLGPRDPYRPPYPVNARVIQVLNQPTGANIQITNAPVTINRQAVTIVPAQVMTTSAQVAGAVRPGSVAAGPPAAVQFRPQAAPTRATIGATQAVLRQVNPAGLTAPAAHVAPGPSLAQAEPRELAPHQPGPQIGPGAVLGGAAAGAIVGGMLRQPSPRAALPDLRQHGAVPPAFQERPGAIGGVRPPSMPAVPSVASPAAPRGPVAIQGAVPAPQVARPSPMPGRPEIVPMPRRAEPMPAPQRVETMPAPQRVEPRSMPQHPPPRVVQGGQFGAPSRPAPSVERAPPPAFAQHAPPPQAPRQAAPQHAPPPHPGGGGPDRHER